MSDSTVYLITGANRGIGFGLVEAYSGDSKNIIIAGVRDPSKVPALQELSKTAQAKILIYKIDSADEAGNLAAAKEIKASVGRVDVLWANAGVGRMAPILQDSVASFEEHLKVNALGPIVLFKSFYSLLQKSTKEEKKFIVTSTALGSQTIGGWHGSNAYGVSKAAVNHFGVRVHKEHGEQDKIVAVLAHPGLVATDINADWGLKAGDNIDFGGSPIPILTGQQAAEYMKAIEQKATLATHGGKFFNFDGAPLPW